MAVESARGGSSPAALQEAESKAMTHKRTPMIPQFRWVLVDKHGLWRVANETYANKRIALKMRDAIFGRPGGFELVRDKYDKWRRARLDVHPVRVRIGPI